MPTLLCPDCHTSLQDLSTPTVHLQHCPDCQGLWLTQQTFIQTCKHAELNVAAPQRRQTRSTPHHPNLAPVRYRHCPDCQQQMSRMNFAQRSGIIMDVCSSHGIWLDHDELERIVQFIQSGGLQSLKQNQSCPSSRHPSAQVLHPMRPIQPVLSPASKPSALWDIPADLVLEAVCELISSAFDGLG